MESSRPSSQVLHVKLTPDWATACLVEAPFGWERRSDRGVWCYRRGSDGLMVLVHPHIDGTSRRWLRLGFYSRRRGGVSFADIREALALILTRGLGAHALAQVGPRTDWKSAVQDQTMVLVPIGFHPI